MPRPILLIALVLVLIAPPSLAQAPHHTVMTPDALKWVEPPTFPGARLAMVQGDPGKEGPFAYRVKFPANYKVAPHFHKAIENVTVLSGTFYLGLGTKLDQGSGQMIPTGGFVSVPATHPHYAWTATEETLIQVHGVGPTDITFVNPADDPRKK
jgi:uncharacterized RmlC-like cupin family protein